MTVNQSQLNQLRKVITESLRVQRDGDPIEYIDGGTSLQDATAKQNHAIFARRGCGKTLLLHDSARRLGEPIKAVYLNCEDFKKHTFPNVLIEILTALFREMGGNLPGWFGRKKRSRDIIDQIVVRLGDLRKQADEQDEQIKKLVAAEMAKATNAGLKAGSEAAGAKIGALQSSKERTEIESSFRIHTKKLEELDKWLPELKDHVREFFKISSSVKAIFLQIDDLYHLKRTDQAFVVDYIHRLCKDVPLYFKIATLRHASTLYADRDGQPIGAQERHDYQPINIDYTFNDFAKTSRQNAQILYKFGEKVKVSNDEIDSLFKGHGFDRLVMAGGGVPRDFLSLFLEILSGMNVANGDKIGKDEVRLLSKPNFERRIEELKQDSQGEEQAELIRGIYVIRQFCLDRQTNVFLVSERMLQENDRWRSLIYRLLDYRVIHNCATALTHKSQAGTYQAYAIDIGAYAHLRKLEGRFNEIDVSDGGAKERMRSAPILDDATLLKLLGTAPENAEAALLQDDVEA